ncbi:MAG: V-type ATPase subunit [Acidilobaceae archaeon]
MRIQLPWVVPLDYAKPIVVARALKARLLRPEVLRELALAKDFDEAVSVLGESLYPEAREAKNLLQAQMAVWRGYFRSVYKLAQACPQHLREVALLFAREEELKDLMIIAHKVRYRLPLQERLPSMFYETLAYSLSREPEKLLSIDSLLDAIRDTWAHSYLAEALSLVEEHRIETPLYTLSALYTVRMYSETLEPLSSLDLRDLEVIVCPKLEPLLFSGLIHSKAYGIPVDAVKAILKPLSICGWRVGDLVEAYSRALDFRVLAEELSKSMGVRVVGETLDEVLASILIGGGRRLRRIAYKVMAGDPYRPAFIIAPLALLKLEVEDVLLILASKVYKVKPEDLINRLSIEI